MGHLVWPDGSPLYPDRGTPRGRSLIIDPPVTPYSESAMIEAWIAELQEVRREYSGDPAALQAIHEAEDLARSWLEDPLPPQE